MKSNYSLLTIIILLLFCNTVAYAQEWKSGVKTGLSISSLSQGEDNIFADDFESITDVEIGIFTGYLLNNKWALQLELLYTNRGGKRDGLQPIPPNDVPAELSALLPAGLTPYAAFDNESTLRYLEVPILLKHTWGIDWKFYINAGPYIGFLLSAEQKTSGNSSIFIDSSGQNPLQIPTPGGPMTIISSFDNQIDVKDNLETINFGIHGGFGVIRKLNENNELFIDIRGSKGFVPIQKDEFLGQTTLGGLVFSVGYAYNFTKNDKK